MANLEELKKRLYRGKENFGERMTAPDIVRPRKYKSISWREPSVSAPRGNGWFWGTLIFILIIAGIAAFWFWGPFSFFKAEFVSVEIIGEKEIKSGDRITWQVKATNKNNKNLEDAVLVFNFPDSSSPVQGQRPEGIFRERRPLGVIKTGESVTETFNAYVFGGREAVKKVSAVVEYRPEGASSIFAADAELAFSIARAPVSVAFKIPEELRSGQEVNLDVLYSSLSEEKLSDLSIALSFPDGFEFVSASPAFLPPDKNIWKIGDLAPAQSGKISIRGIIRGSDIESKVFKASLGIYDHIKKTLMPYDEASEVIVLRAPYLDVKLTANGRDDLIVSPGDFVTFEVSYKNNLSKEVKNASLEVILDGSPIDFKTLKIDGGGSFRETTRSIIWNAGNYADFKSLLSGDAAKLKFSFKLKSSFPLDSSASRPKISVKAIFRSGGAVAGFEGTDLTGSSVYEIKVSSKLQLVSRAIYFNSQINNIGPLPPAVNKETTYTVIWTLANMSNDLDGVVVKSTLPPYINFKNVISPADTNVIFNKNTGEIEWRAGRILAGTGFLRPALQIVFQIGFVPSEDQIGFAPILINETEATGRDTFTDQTISSKDAAITTDLPDDPSVGFNQKKVVP